MHNARARALRLEENGRSHRHIAVHGSMCDNSGIFILKYCKLTVGNPNHHDFHTVVCKLYIPRQTLDEGKNKWSILITRRVLIKYPVPLDI